MLTMSQVNSFLHENPFGECPSQSMPCMGCGCEINPEGAVCFISSLDKWNIITLFLTITNNRFII